MIKIAATATTLLVSSLLGCGGNSEPKPEIIDPVVIEGPTIAGTEVPHDLHCEEDEVISLLPKPTVVEPWQPIGTDYDKIGCVHIEVIAREVVAPL